MKTFSLMRKLIVVALIAMAQWAATESAVAQTVVEYLHTDALGSPVAVTNQAGTVIERNDYEPYGAVIGKPNYQGIGYTGHMQDAATGLTYMQQRYYDPQVGMFLSVDPLTADSNPIGQFNRYRYANNNPYKFTDPDGRQSVVQRILSSLPPFITGQKNEPAPPPQDDGGPRGEIKPGNTRPSRPTGDEVRPPRRDRDGNPIEPGARDKNRRADAGQRERARDRSRDSDGDPTCLYCGKKTTNEPGTRDSSTADHVVPWSKGGTTTDDNLENACLSCNSGKRDRELGTEWVPPKDRAKK